MLRIIEGKSYNTETARKLCFTGNNAGAGDFKSEDSHLYMTKKGRFFIAGSGGAMSRFARACDLGGTSGGDGVIVVTKEDARALLEAANAVDTLLELFEIEDA